MFQFISTYKRFFIVILTITLFMPCTIKRDLKQDSAKELHQNLNNSSAKTLCSAFCSVKQNTTTHVSVQKKLTTTDFDVISFQNNAAQIGFSVQLDAYISLKEKIPTHIRHQQFLI